MQKIFLGHFDKNLAIQIRKSFEHATILILNFKYFKGLVKTGPRPLGKEDPIPKLTVWIKNSLLNKFESADFRYINSFLKC